MVVKTTNESDRLSVESRGKVDEFIRKYTDSINHDWGEEMQKILVDLNADIEKINSESAHLELKLKRKNKYLKKQKH